METPSGSPPSDRSGTPPERPAPPFALSDTHEESAREAAPVRGEDAAETPAEAALDVTPESTAPETGIAGETGATGAPASPESARNATAPAPETRPLAPSPPPPLRYGEPRPAITSSRVGEPIRVGEPAVAARVQGDPNVNTQIPSPGGAQGSGAASPGQNQGSPAAYAPQLPSSTPTAYTPQPPAPPPQSPWSPAPPSQPQTQPETSPPAYTYPPPSYSPPPANAIAPPVQPPRPYGTSGPTAYPPPPATGATTAPPPAGYAPVNTLTAGPAPTRPASGVNNTLLAVIALLLAAIAIVQILNLVRPTRLDTSEPVPVQTKALSQTTRDQVKNTLDNAQKAITDINAQAQMDYNAATTDAQRQAILAKYSFTLQQIIAQEQYDMLRIMQEQSTP